MKDNYLKYFLKEDYKNTPLNELVPIMLYFSATSTLMMAYRFYKEYMTRAARECGSLSGRDKNLCMLKFELDGLKAQKNQIEAGLKDCDKAKDPRKCKEKLTRELRKIGPKLDKKQKQFDMLYKLVQKEERDDIQKRR